MAIRKCPRCPVFSPRAKRPPACTAPIGWAEIRFRTCWYSESAPAGIAAEFAKHNGPAADRRGGASSHRGAGAGSFRARPIGREPVPDPIRSAGSDAGPGGHRAHRKRNAAGAGGDRRELRARAGRAGIAGHREYNNGWHTAIDLENMLIVSEADHARGVAARRRAAARNSAKTSPAKTRSGANTTS